MTMSQSCLLYTSPLCADKNLVLDYKNAEQIRKFVNDKGKILPRRATGAVSYTHLDVYKRQYGGFYIGRYETGNLVASPNSKPVVVKGNNNIGSVRWYYMYQNSKLIGANSNVVSTMIWGSMWDRALIWLTETGDKTYSDLMDSRSWGNYDNSTGKAATNSGSKQLTGTNDAWQANNIYDLAGNVYEWTIEASSTYSRVYRGGYCSFSGSDSPASSRINNYPSYTSSYVGSRSALFVALNSD